MGNHVRVTAAASDNLVVVSRRKRQRIKRSFTPMPVGMRSENPSDIYRGGLYGLLSVLVSISNSFAWRSSDSTHPLASNDLRYESESAIDAVDAFSWLAMRGHFEPSASHLAQSARRFADALQSRDLDSVVEIARQIKIDLNELSGPEISRARAMFRNIRPGAGP